MRRHESMADWYDRMEARAARIDAAPHSVYRAFDSFGLLLYIGCSMDVDKRMAQHRSGSKWHRYAETIGVAGPYPRTEALALEKAAIDTEASYFNATQADINRTQANRNAARKAMWDRGWYRPQFELEWDTDGPEWHKYVAASEAWDTECNRIGWRLKLSGRYPYLTDAERVERYLGARATAEAACSELAS